MVILKPCHYCGTDVVFSDMGGMAEETKAICKDCRDIEDHIWVPCNHPDCDAYVYMPKSLAGEETTCFFHLLMEDSME